MNGRLGKSVLVLAPLLAFTAFLAAWEALVTISDIPRILLPRPTEVASEAWAERSRLLDYTVNTGVEATVGLLAALLIAIVISILIHSNDALSDVMGAASGAGRAVPAVVLYPIVTVFLGTSAKAVQVIVTIAIFPFIVIYVLSGLRQKSPLDELITVVGGSSVQRFTQVRIPVAIPYLMTGIRTCLPLAVITAVIAEYFGGSATTLGAYIKIQSKMLHAVELWSAIVFACVLGLAAYTAGILLEYLIQRRMGMSSSGSHS